MYEDEGVEVVDCVALAGGDESLRAGAGFAWKAASASARVKKLLWEAPEKPATDACAEGQSVKIPVFLPCHTT